MIPSTSSRFRKSVPKAKAGDRVAVLSPAFAAPGMAPEVHEQAMAQFDDHDYVEIAVVASFYAMVGRMLDAMGVQLEPEVRDYSPRLP